MAIKKDLERQAAFIAARLTGRSNYQNKCSFLISWVEHDIDVCLSSQRWKNWGITSFKDMNAKNKLRI